MADTLVSKFLTIGSTTATEIIQAGSWVTTILSITLCDNSGSGNNIPSFSVGTKVSSEKIKVLGITR